MAVVGSAYVSKFNNFYLSTTQTLRNQPVNIYEYECDFIIEVDGTIHSNRSPTQDQAYVMFVGGLDTFINEKVYREPKFYISERQKVTLYNILKQVAIRTDAAQISSSVEELDQIANATYFNYCG